MALDYGDRKIGIAISDPMQIIAKPLQTLDNTTNQDILLNLNKIILEHEVQKVVVGLPVTLKNKHSIQTEKVILFIDFLKNNISIPVDSYDERLSSQIAIQSLVSQGVKTGHNKKEIDKTAAAIFLQNYLDDKSK
ncbi:MAG: Holliday junction resolvase RuvX [Candidatus Marinimicrobia bacterium]|nr:Holliday junction resolvase RuvX [Candidatus Neomarinimicrobiota bacterium]|tara:strand:- start:10126 stop:10530 length:405 start_codon:yes stop_codon:yes gene_type:complete